MATHPRHDRLPSRKFDVLGPLPRGELTVRYPLVPARSHLEALLIVHRDGLGHGAVGIVEGELAFTNPEDQALVAGRWEVAEVACNSDEVEFVIPFPIELAA